MTHLPARSSKRSWIAFSSFLAFLLLFLLVAYQVRAQEATPNTPLAASRLLLSEVVVTPTDGEFVEIYNPGGTAVDLSDVYLTDATFAGGGTYYYGLVTGGGGGGGFGDFFARFPDGASIGAGEYQVIAMTGSTPYSGTYGVLPTYELFEDDAAPDAIPDMREARVGSINNQGGLTNGGEVVVLFYWDGMTDLVTDLDYLVWGDKDEAIDKTGVSIDGPDADTITSTYLADTPIGSQIVVDTGAHPFGDSWQRNDLTEGNEIQTGGNGVDGNDETSENTDVTWCANPPTPGTVNICGSVSDLLLTEIAVTPTDGEFVEIHNPGTGNVDLSDVYLTDATFAGGGTFYYGIVIGGGGGGGFGDFFARFPDGAIIGPGEYQTIAMTGSSAYSTTYGFNPTYELFEDDGTPDAIPDMREARAGSINNQGGLTNSGEVTVLFHWDGVSDLVADLDYVVWGDKDEAIDKTGVSIDGPDADTITSTYQADTPILNQAVLATSSHSFGNSWQRADLTEGTETKTGGNGITGHDETSENLDTTWCEELPTPGALATCGGGLQALLLSEVVVTPTDGEFIELHNAGPIPVDLSDVYLTDATFAGGPTYYYQIVTGGGGGGSFTDFHARFPDGASIGAGEYQVIALTGSTPFSNTYGVLPTYELFEDDGAPDAIPDMREAQAGSINDQGGLSNSGEVVVLYYWDGATDLVADLDYFVWGDKAEAVDKTAVSIDGPDGNVITSTYLADTPIISQTAVAGGSHAFGTSWQRDDLTEGAEIKTGGNGISGNNEMSEDLDNTWCERAPNPGAESTCGQVTFGSCGDSATAINAIQGNGLTSPMIGANVVIEGVVVADVQTTLNGFYIQEENNQFDNDPMTSEGIFVYDPDGTPDVVNGDKVRLQATVSEFRGLTELSGVSNFAACGTDTITPVVVTLPLTTTADWEYYEGMLVTINSDLYVTDNYRLGRFGQVRLSINERLPQPTNVVLPGTAAIDLQDLNNRSFVTIDDADPAQNTDPTAYPTPGLTFTNTLRGGDMVAGGITGVVDHYDSDSSDEYRVHTTQPVTFTHSNTRQAMPDAVGGDVQVASFNVLNYFSTIDTGSPICGPSQDLDCRGADSPEEITRQRDKIINAIVTMNADVVGLMEIENHVSDDALKDLINGLNAKAGAGTYAHVDSGAIGTDAIKVALIYQTASVTTTGSFKILDSTVISTFIDTKNRPVLIQTFTDKATGGKFTVAVNHLKSKGSACDDVGDPDLGDGQANCNLTRQKAAQALVDYLATDPTGYGVDRNLIIGDLNSYAMEDPIQTIENAGYTNLIKLFQGEKAYGYTFEGQWGYLDHALASQALTPLITGVTDWHINSDEPIVLDYNLEFKTTNQQTVFYSPEPYRASDHDPVIVGLNTQYRVYMPLILSPNQPAPTGQQSRNAAPTAVPLVGLMMIPFLLVGGAAHKRYW